MMVVESRRLPVARPSDKETIAGKTRGDKGPFKMIVYRADL
jgi:hypothetical protein